MLWSIGLKNKIIVVGFFLVFLKSDLENFQSFLKQTGKWTSYKLWCLRICEYQISVDDQI